MTPEQLDVAARELYEASPNQCKPTWYQIGDATKSVWRDYVIAGDFRIMRLAEYYQGDQ